LSFAATEGILGKRTLRLHGQLSKKNILILVDSGSSSTFISSTAVARLGYKVTAAPTINVTAANGGQLPSSAIVPEVTWYTQEQTFSTTARVLDLNHYDMIFGMD
jgi:predicted aspartyl protease